MMRDPIHGILVPDIGGDVRADAHSWRVAAATLALALAWIVACYWRTGAAMLAIWARSDTFAHGFIVLPITLWLVWRARERLLAVVPRPGWWTLLPLTAAGFGWLLGELGTVGAVSQFALVATLVLTVPAVLGVSAARTIAFPLGFLFFAVPIGEFMMPQLMEWTADITVLALKLSGIPVYREGQHFSIPTGSWSVVEACSGVRYLIASLVVGTLYAYLTYRSLRRRLAFVGFSIAVPIVANWARAYMIVMLGHLSGNKIAVGVDHMIYGWLFFGIVMLMMFWIGAHWHDDSTPAASASMFVAPRKAVSVGEYILVAAALAMVTGIWPLGYRSIERNDVAAAPVLSTLGGVGAWRAVPGGLTSWQPQFQNPSADLHQTFRRGDVTVGLYVGYYRSQGDERKLVSSDNLLVKSNDPAWARVRSGTRTVTATGQAIDADTMELRGAAGERLVAWHWYWIDGRLTASDYRAKAWIAWSRLIGHGDDAATIVVYAPKEGAGEVALDAFIHDVWPSIMSRLELTRENR